MQEELLIGSQCKGNFSQDQHTWGTSHRINMQEEVLTGSTCKENFSQDHARAVTEETEDLLLSISKELTLGQLSRFYASWLLDNVCVYNKTSLFTSSANWSMNDWYRYGNITEAYEMEVAFSYSSRGHCTCLWWSTLIQLGIIDDNDMIGSLDLLSFWQGKDRYHTWLQSWMSLNCQPMKFMTESDIDFEKCAEKEEIQIMKMWSVHRMGRGHK